LRCGRLIINYYIRAHSSQGRDIENIETKNSPRNSNTSQDLIVIGQGGGDLIVVCKVYRAKKKKTDYITPRFSYLSAIRSRFGFFSGFNLPPYVFFRILQKTKFLKKWGLKMKMTMNIFREMEGGHLIN
jgi:hypothetical protein